MDKKTLVNYILIGVGIIVAISFILNFFITNEEQTTISRTEYRQRDKQMMKKTFLKACNKYPGFEDYCNCGWNYLERNYTISELVKLAHQEDKDYATVMYEYCKHTLK